MLEERSARGAIDLGAFYVRRARRLLPALAALLTMYSAFEAGPFQVGHPRIGLLAERVLLAGSYLGNVAVAFHVHDVISGTALLPLWSLAQEEQFYAVWPLLLILGIRSRRFLGWLVITIVALVVYQHVLRSRGATSARVYYGPDTNPIWLLTGSALAVLRLRGLAVSAVAGIIGLGCATWDIGSMNFGWEWVGETATTPVLLASYAAIVGAAYGSGVIARALSFRPLVWVGSISYSIYLWQIVALASGVTLGTAFGIHGEWSRAAGLPILALVAWLSYRYVEQPFRRRRGHRHETTPLVAATARG